MAPQVCYGPTLTCLDCRHEFTMARSKANWRRLKEIGSHFTQYKDYWVHLQCWEAPWESAGAMAGMAALAFYPHLVLAGCLVSQVPLRAGMQPSRQQRPLLAWFCCLCAFCLVVNCVDGYF